MKKITQKVLTETQRDRITLHTQEFIRSNFEKAPQDSNELLYNNIQFMTQNGYKENILNQTLTKAAFPRISFQKNQIAKHMTLSQKVEIICAYEKSDFRFIGEIMTASSFADSSNSIKKIIMNSEHPENPINVNAIINPGNRNKDITLSLSTRQVLLDIKAGNNANNPFSGILAEKPFLNNTPYCVLNNDALSLSAINDKRLDYFKNDNTQLRDNVKKDIYKYIQEISKVNINQIQKNILIQEKILQVMGDTHFIQQPSFYYVHIIQNQPKINHIFKEKLAPYITNDIFDNTKNAQCFIKNSLKIYNETVTEILGNITKSKNAWMNSGFEKIADGIFD